MRSSRVKVYVSWFEIKRHPSDAVFMLNGMAGKKCRLVGNIGARLGSKANFRSDKIQISS